MKNNKITLTIWIVTIIVLIISTLVKTPIYDKWWFVIQLFVFAGSTFCDLYRSYKCIRPSVVAIYISVLLILLGGCLTFTTSQNGNMHLNENESVNTFKIGENQIQMPFYVTLKSFDVVYYPGTMSHADYVSNVVISDDGNILKEGKISMNNIMKYKGFRFFNEDFDEDMNGVTLTVQHDPWGITVTYIGYILMMISMLILFIKKITTKDVAADLGDIYIYNSGRIATGLIVGGLMMLVAVMSSANPKITPLVPVLSSPLLGLHVAIIMIAYG